VDGHEHSAGSAPHEPEELEEVLDGEIVETVSIRVLAAQRRTVTPAPSGWSAAPVQTAVAAATGFIAGAATLAILRHYGLSRAAGRELESAREDQRGRGAGEPPQVRGGTYVVSIRTIQTPR
jgi:hypothetical protein